MVIIGLVGADGSKLGALVTAYVLVLATVGPLAERWRGRTSAVPAPPRPAAPDAAGG